MLEGHVGRCFINADVQEYDLDNHWVEKTIYDTDNYDKDGEHIECDSNENEDNKRVW